MPDADAVVYDLDGTLVRLPVDWEAARESVVEVYVASGVPVRDASLWDLLERSESHGLRGPVHEAIERHERQAAHEAERLPTADALATDSRPAAVVSLNAEAACRIALEAHDLHPYLEAVIGRDSVDEYKPHPEPLVAAAERLGVPPADVLFIGDSERDAETATRAGTQFSYVDGAPRS